MNYILSYPRSGNTWFRFIIEYFSSRPTKGLSSTDKPIHKMINKPLKHVKGKPNFQKGHWASDVKDKSGKLILVVRNPKEVIVRQNYHHVSEGKLDKKDVDWYMSLLKLYDGWGDTNRLLVYYEDLIENPKQEINNLLDFLDVGSSKLNEFMDSYDHYFNLSVNRYNQKGPGSTSKTKGKELIYHSKKLSEKEIQGYNEYINSKFPHLKKYVDKYE